MAVLDSQQDYNKFAKKLRETFDSSSFGPHMLAFGLLNEFDEEQSLAFAAFAISWFVQYYKYAPDSDTLAHSKVRWIAHDVVKYTDLGRRIFDDMVTAEW